MWSLGQEDLPIIIRLLRGRVPAGQETALVARLRNLGGDGQGSVAGFVGATFGFRRNGPDLGFMALSTWQSIEAISRMTAGSPSAPWPSQQPGRDLASTTIELFEVADESLAALNPEAAALGLIWGRVARHAEAAAHEMIRQSAPAVAAAGVRGIHVGRRFVDGQTEILVVASWRDRLALHAFAQQRQGRTIDPAFLELLTDWRFETYDCLAPGGLLPAPGPAVLLADDSGRYVDASPAIEGLLGVPAELVLARTLGDLTPVNLRPAVAGAWSDFLAAGRGEGVFDLLRPDGRIVRVTYRARANCPVAGIHASLLSASDEAGDDRPLADIVADLFPSSAVQSVA